MSKLPRLQVHANGRFVVTEQQQPFFWLGDTAWELFHRLDRTDAEWYLTNRQQKGFTVIQAVILAECDGLNTPNAYGHRPLIENDPTRPNEAYFAHVDYIINSAQEKGLYIGLLPTWGDKVNRAWGAGPVIFTPENAFAYGAYLGTRYRDASNIIWVLGGDRESSGYEAIWRQMAAGIRAGTGERPFMTFHPQGGHSSSEWFHQDDWLCCNMIQSGHQQRDSANWQMISHDYQLSPAKPVLDGEPNYEDHPINWQRDNGYFRDYDVRKQAYRAVFAGAFGHTYGNQCIWQMYQEGRVPIAFPEFSWRQACDRPGAVQMIHLRNLMLSRPFLSRTPDQSMLASGEGEGALHAQATRDVDGSYALIYIPTAQQTVSLDIRTLAGTQATAWWYDPRRGQAARIGTYATTQVQDFTTPASGPDWVLVLDDSSRNFGAPGQRV